MLPWVFSIIDRKANPARRHISRAPAASAKSSAVCRTHRAKVPGAWHFLFAELPKLPKPRLWRFRRFWQCLLKGGDVCCRGEWMTGQVKIHPSDGVLKRGSGRAAGFSGVRWALPHCVRPAAGYLRFGSCPSISGTANTPSPRCMPNRPAAVPAYHNEESLPPGQLSLRRSPRTGAPESPPIR